MQANFCSWRGSEWNSYKNKTTEFIQLCFHTNVLYDCLWFSDKTMTTLISVELNSDELYWVFECLKICHIEKWNTKPLNMTAWSLPKALPNKRDERYEMIYDWLQFISPHGMRVVVVCATESDSTVIEDFGDDWASRWSVFVFFWVSVVECMSVVLWVQETCLPVRMRDSRSRIAHTSLEHFEQDKS